MTFFAKIKTFVAQDTRGSLSAELVILISMVVFCGYVGASALAAPVDTGGDVIDAGMKSAFKVARD